MTDLDAFIAGLPKAELHMHIEGSLEPELMFALAERNGVAIPFDSVEAVRAAYSFSNLQDFLDIYYQGANVLRTAADFKDLATAYFDRIVAVGLDSSELGHPPEKFARVFAAAKALGLKLVAHAGEEGPPAYVYEALDLLHIDRLDHGNRSLEDKALTDRLVAERMTLTVCPLSNVKLCNVPAMDVHPIDRMLDLGLRATINSDDPAYFGGYINDNYPAAAHARGLDREQLATLARNSFLGSFLTEEEKAAHLARVDAYAASA